MKFVFTRTFVLLVAVGVGLLSFGWISRGVLLLTLLYDLMLIAVAAVDYFGSEKKGDFKVERDMEERFAMGARNRVAIKVTNHTARPISFRIKDEYPAEMELLDPREVQMTVATGRSREWHYDLLPTARGKYSFGNTQVRFRSKYGL